MLLDDAFKEVRGNLFRVHYQFVFANTKKYHYDFLGICFGPTTLTDRAQHPNHFANNLTGPEYTPQ